MKVAVVGGGNPGFREHCYRIIKVKIVPYCIRVYDVKVNFNHIHSTRVLGKSAAPEVFALSG